MIFVVYAILSSLLVYQGITFNGILNLPYLSFNFFSTNSYMLVVRMVLNKYTIILGVFGLIVSLIAFISAIKGNTTDSDGEVEKISVTGTIITITVFYGVFSILTIL